MTRVVTRGVVALVVAACALLFALDTGDRSRAASEPSAGPFVAVVQRAGVTQSIGLFSASTGSRIKWLGSFGMDFTNNGLAVTPDDTAVFFTLIPRHGGFLKLVRLDVASGRRRVVARGARPAIDNAGARLAFMAGRGNVEVRDLHTGAHRTLDVSRLLGSAIDPLNSLLVWLADEQTLVMLPAEPAIPVGAPRALAPHTAGRCRPTRAEWPIVFIHVPPAGRLTARCRTVRASAADPAPLGGAVLAASPTDPSAVWIASFDGPASTLQQVAPTGPAHRVARLGRGVLPEAIDRTSTRMLYIAGHPPALWEAAIASGRLTHRRRLVARSRFGAAAW